MSHNLRKLPDNLYIVEPAKSLSARWGTQAFYTKLGADLHADAVGQCIVSHWEHEFDYEDESRRWRLVSSNVVGKALSEPLGL